MHKFDQRIDYKSRRAKKKESVMRKKGRKKERKKERSEDETNDQIF